MDAPEEVSFKLEVCLHGSCWWERALQAEGLAVQRHAGGKRRGACRELGIVQGC